jgi:flagellar biosynthesis protein FlhF
VQIKQFAADTIDEVLAQVRAELGEDAMILQTKRVVRGGIGGFFGREGVEVTAAAGAEQGAANREAAASVVAPSVDAIDAGAPAEPAPDAPEDPFRRHLDGRLAAAEEAEEAFVPATPAPASPAAAYARGGAPFAPGGTERSRAILEAARAAVREAHEAALASVDESLLPGIAQPSPESAPEPEPEPEPEAEPEPVPELDEPVALAAPAPAPAPRARRAAARATATGPEALEPVRAELLKAGVDERHLDTVLDGFARSAMPFLAPSAPVRDAVRDHLAARLPVVRDWKPRAAGHTVALVGQTGVGKTSAAAAMAGAYRAAGLAVALVAAGPGAHDALAGHARRLDVQLFTAQDGDALASLRATLADRDVIIVDTHGRSHTQLAEIEALAGLLGPAKPDEVHLVLPAATAAADLGDLQRRFRLTGVNRVILTKLDETRVLGNLANVPLRIGKPLAFLSDGTSVPGSLAPADARRVAEALLP